MSKQALDFGRPQERAINPSIEERQNSNPIAREHKLMLSRIPKGKGPLSIQPVNASFTLFFVKMEYDFCIGPG